MRILVVDDSAFVRALLKEALTLAGFEVVGEAGDGLAAERLIRELHPDVVTMDVLMPLRNGIDTVRAVMARTPVPIVIVADRVDAALAMEALAAGAFDVIEKPAHGQPASGERMISVLAAAARSNPARPVVDAPVAPAPRRASVCGIGASTGGPRVLELLLSRLGPKTVPLLIAQHTIDGFAQELTKWLGRASGYRVDLARDGELPEPGRAYLAPDGHDLRLVAGRFAIGPCADAHGGPSVDRLLTSLATSGGRRAAAVILSGMGQDGARGVTAILAGGGQVAVQTPKSAVVAGMPAAAIAACPNPFVADPLALCDWISSISAP